MMLVWLVILLGVAPLRYMLVEGANPKDFKPVPAFALTLVQYVAMMGLLISLLIWLVTT